MDAPASRRSARRFHGLMPYRVREVLLVCSPYDAFTLEEDGLLTEQVFLEYMDVSQPGAPRFTNDDLEYLTFAAQPMTPEAPAVEFRQPASA